MARALVQSDLVACAFFHRLMDQIKKTIINTTTVIVTISFVSEGVVIITVVMIISGIIVIHLC